jgi:hypothetical protein
VGIAAAVAPSFQSRGCARGLDDVTVHVILHIIAVAATATVASIEVVRVLLLVVCVVLLLVFVGVFAGRRGGGGGVRGRRAGFRGPGNHRDLRIRIRVSPLFRPAFQQRPQPLFLVILILDGGSAVAFAFAAAGGGSCAFAAHGECVNSCGMMPGDKPTQQFVGIDESR